MTIARKASLYDLHEFKATSEASEVESLLAREATGEVDKGSNKEGVEGDSDVPRAFKEGDGSEEDSLELINKA